MRKHFLLLFLMAILPLAGWAVDGAITAPTGAAGLTYDGTAKQLLSALGAVEGADYELRYAVTTSATEAPVWSDFAAADALGDLTATDAGIYYVYFASYNNATGQPSAIGPKVSVVIDKAELVEGANKDYTKPAAVGDALTYSGSAQTLISAGAIVTSPTGTGSAEKCGSFTYALGTYNEATAQWVAPAASAYAAALPKGTDAGAYKIYWKLSGSANYAEATGTIDKTILAKALDAYDATKYSFKVPSTANYTYTGAAMTNLPTITVKSGSKTLTAGTDYDVVWYKKVGAAAIAYTAEKKEVPTYAKHQGDAIVYYAQVEGKGNYSGNIKHDEDATESKIWKMTVAQKSLMTYVQPITKIYDGVRIVTTGTVADGDVNITAAEIVATGLVEGDEALTAQLKAKFSRGSETATAIPDETLNEWNTTATAPKDYRKKGYPMVAYVLHPAAPAEGDFFIDDNYAITAMNVGALTINQRELKVTAKKQTAQYTGEELDINNTITLTGDNQTVIVAAADATTGIVGVDDVTGLIAIALDDSDPDVEYIAMKNYPNAILVSATAAQATSNYFITPTPGDFEITGKPLKLIARTFTKEYGYELADDVKDWLTDDPTVTELKTDPVFVVKDANGDEVSGLLDRGTYTITISNYADLAPDNYTIKAADVFPGTLTITKKALKVTVKNQTLSQNATDPLDDSGLLQGLGYIEFAEGFAPVNDETIKFTIKGTGTFTLENVNEAGIANAITVALDALTEEQEEEGGFSNSNYTLLDANVTKGKLFVVGPNTIVLNRNLTPVENGGYDDPAVNTAAALIEQAAAACTADATLKYSVKFDAYKMIAQKWYTLVLPFETNVAEVSKAFGYAVVDVFDTKNNNTDNVHFSLHMGKIEANQPFIIKVVNEDIANINAQVDMSSVSFTQKVIKYATDPSVQDATTGAPNKFIGVYSGKYQGFDPEVDYVFGTSASATTYQRSSENFYIFPLSAYIKFGTVQPQSGARMIIIDEPDGSTTAINALTNEVVYSNALAKGWYTLNGVQLQSAPTTKGIYINNGKKVVIK